VNLAPADIKKEGAAFDLPTAVGILAAEELVRPDRWRRSSSWASCRWTAPSGRSGRLVHGGGGA